MTEQEQCRRAYATLVGRVDSAITTAEAYAGQPGQERAGLHFLIGQLTRALEEAEDIFLEEPEA